MDHRALLREIVAKKSYREGDFTLASGQKSSFYVDLKATTLSPQGAKTLGLAVCTLLKEEGLLGRVKAVGGLTLGADPIATAVSISSLDSRYGADCPDGLAAFIVRKESKAHGTTKMIEGLDSVQRESLVIVVEDVSTTGASAWQAVEKVQAAGFRVAGVLSIVDREQGARDFFHSKGVTFFSLLSLTEVRAQYRA